MPTRALLQGGRCAAALPQAQVDAAARRLLPPGGGGALGCISRVSQRCWGGAATEDPGWGELSTLRAMSLRRGEWW